jgi:hypothetical protein
MRHAALTAAVLSMIGGAACAQNEGIKGLESCSRAARQAGDVCSNPTNDPVQRLDCLQKARAAQLECLQHVPLGMSAGSEILESPMLDSPPTSGPARPEAPAVSADRSTNAQTPEATGSVRSVSPPLPTGKVPSESASPAGTFPSPPVASPSDTSTATVLTDKHIVPSGSSDMPIQSPNTNWVVSETTSPVDYSALITATIRSASSVKDAPSVLAIRCRQLHTELFVRTEGTWSVARGADVKVEYQINDQSLVRLRWAASADGKTVSYRDDAVGLLRSLSEGALLKINVLDKPGAGHDATFQLAGLDAIRKKIAVACKWGSVLDAMSSGKR